MRPLDLSHLPLTITGLAQSIRLVGGIPMLIGGTARALLMGTEPRDYDLEVFGLTDEQLRRALRAFDPGVVEVGQAFSVFKLGDIDISLPRRDSKMGPGHRGFRVEGDPFMSVTEAARRRDFTINAISIHPLTGEVIDPYGGIWDIGAKRLQAVDSHTFIEDPLRVLRAMQFSSRLGFTIAPHTIDLCHRMRHTLRELPVERIWWEMDKLLLSPRPSLGLTAGLEMGVIDALFPELYDLVGCPQDPEWHPEGDVWTHTLQAVDIAATLAADLPRPQRLAVLLGTLCHDLGKPTTTGFQDGRVRSHAHDEAGVAITERFLDRLNVHAIDDQPVRQWILGLVAHHLKPMMFYQARASLGDGAFRRLALKVPFDLLSMVATADSLGRVPPGIAVPHVNPRRVAAIDWFMERASDLKVEATGPTPLLLGRHCLALGMRPGPEVGRICRAVFELQLDGSVTTVDEAIAAARRIREQA